MICHDKFKAAHIIAKISIKKFVQLGAIPLFQGAYVIFKNYNLKSVDGESAALIGINKKWINARFKPKTQFGAMPLNVINLDVILYILRRQACFSKIDGIEELSEYRLIRALNTFRSEILSASDDELFLFNIEPKGTVGKLQVLYPNANLTLPGGAREKLEDPVDCAIREFTEETGLQLSRYFFLNTIISNRMLVDRDGYRRHYFMISYECDYNHNFRFDNTNAICSREVVCA